MHAVVTYLTSVYVGLLVVLRHSLIASINNCVHSHADPHTEQLYVVLLLCLLTVGSHCHRGGFYGCNGWSTT